MKAIIKGRVTPLKMKAVLAEAEAKFRESIGDDLFAGFFRRH